MPASTQAVVRSRERAKRSIMSSTCASVMIRGGQKQIEFLNGADDQSVLVAFS